MASTRTGATRLTNEQPTGPGAGPNNEQPGPGAETPTVDEVQRLQTENEDLREQLRAAQQPSDTGEGVTTGRATPKPQQPSFGLSAGEVNDLKQVGVTTSPFTSKTLYADDHMDELRRDDPDFELSDTAKANIKRERARQGVTAEPPSRG